MTDTIIRDPVEFEAERIVPAIARDRNWFGYLTTGNAQAVSDRIERMISGKKYTWVATCHWPGQLIPHRPEVRVGQETRKVDLTSGPLDDGRVMAHITVSDSYGVWGISSVHATQHEARQADANRRTYLHFERDRWGDRLEIEHYSASGNHLWWVIAVEGSGW
jgi:hypothetical protein